MLSPKQMLLYNYILGKVKKERRTEAKKLIHEAFAREKQGTLDKNYLLGMKDSYLAMAKPEAREELEKALNTYLAKQA